MLKGKDRRWHEHGALLALRNALKGGAQGNLCFAKAYVAAKQAVHRIIFLHIAFDFVNATQLDRLFPQIQSAVQNRSACPNLERMHSLAPSCAPHRAW